MGSTKIINGAGPAKGGRVKEWRPATYPIPVSNGLVQPQHRKKIGSAIWLFLLLIDWTTEEENGVGRVHGGKPIKIKELMESLDLQERQVRDQLHRLKAGGYVNLRRTPYGYSIDVLKSKKWVKREWQKTATLSNPDRQESAGLYEETGNNPPERPAENCRCNILDLTVDNKSSALRKKRVRADTDPRVKTLITAFADKYRAIVGSPYPVTKGKDPALLQALLAVGYDVPAIEAVMDRYFADEFYRSKAGFDVGGFKKAFGRINSADTKKRHDYENGRFPSL